MFGYRNSEYLHQLKLTLSREDSKCLISAVLGIELPGAGSIYLSQTLEFIAPIMMEDVITAKVEVVEKDAENNHIKLKTMCKDQNEEEVICGEALMKVPSQNS